MITFVWRALGKPPTQPARPPPSQWHPSPPRQPFLSYHHQHHRHQLRHFTLLLDYLHDLNVVFVSYPVGHLQVNLLVCHHPSQLSYQLDHPLGNIHSLLVQNLVHTMERRMSQNMGWQFNSPWPEVQIQSFIRTFQFPPHSYPQFRQVGPILFEIQLPTISGITQY